MKSQKRQNPISWLLIKPKTSGFILFLILSIVVSYIVLQEYQILKERKSDEMNNTLGIIHKNIDQSLKNCYTTTLTLALTIDDNGIPEDFDTVGKQLLESNGSISAVQLVPNGIIKYIYPMKGNEAAMNLNILKSNHLQKEALKSVQNQKMYFAGPFRLKQGGEGIVGRLPVYNKNVFWGFSAVVIKLDKLLNISGINSLDNSKYYFQISKKNPTTKKEDFFLPEKIKPTKENSVLNIIPDGDWRLYLIAKNPNSFYSSLIVSASLGLILAMLFGIITTLLLKKPAQLQLLVDEQTTKLFNSEIKFKTIFDQASVGIARIDSHSGDFMEVNKKQSDLLGYTLEEIKNKNFQSVTHPDDLEEDLYNLEKLRQGKIREYSMEKRYITKFGKVIWVNLTVSPMWEPNEAVTTHIAIIEDITAKKETEQLIKNSEVRFKSLFDDSPLALWEQDFSAVKKYLLELNLINESPQVLTSYFEKNPEIIQKCFSLIKNININNQCLIQYSPKTKLELLNNTNLLFDEETIPSFTKHLVAICQGENRLNIDAKMKNPEGEIREIHLVYNVMKGYEDTLERVIISTEDITERKSTEKKILNTQHRIESLINTIDGIVWECNAETLEFSFISKKVEEILGYTPQEWLDSPTFWKDHIYEKDKNPVLQYCSDKTSQNLNHDFEYRMIAKDGRIVWLRDIVNVVTKNDKAVKLRGIMIDITKTKEFEKDLKRSFDLVSEQNKRLLNFSYIVSHNLRSHTSNISSLTDLIETADSNEERNHMVQLLKTVSDSLNETMVNLNEVVNIQTNIGLVSEKLNLKNYIDNALTILNEQIETKKISIISSVKNDFEVNYNPAYLESILYNLISNAIRYSNPEQSPTITINCYEENNKTVIAVSDNGIGIDLKRNGNKIFGMYKTFNNNPDSKGIGLFITKNQIEAMGGNITVESEPNVGTTFKIYIS